MTRTLILGGTRWLGGKVDAERRAFAAASDRLVITRPEIHSTAPRPVRARHRYR